jgi:hypothetical protein
MTSKDILYSIPVKVIVSDGSFKCTIPKDIANKLSLQSSDRLIWIFFNDGSIHIKKEELEKR